LTVIVPENANPLIAIAAVDVVDDPGDAVGDPVDGVVDVDAIDGCPVLLFDPGCDEELQEVRMTARAVAALAASARRLILVPTS
jgi:hypothetical protein